MCGFGATQELDPFRTGEGFARDDVCQRDPGVGNAGEMGAGGAELEFFRAANELGAARIQFDVAESAPIVVFAEGRGVVASLEKVAAAAVPAIEGDGPPGVSAAEQPFEAGACGGGEDPVDVVVHEAVAVNPDLLLLGNLGEAAEIHLLFCAGGEDAHAVVAARDHVVHDVGQHEAGSAWNRDLLMGARVAGPDARARHPSRRHSLYEEVRGRGDFSQGKIGPSPVVLVAVVFVPGCFGCLCAY